MSFLGDVWNGFTGSNDFGSQVMGNTSVSPQTSQNVAAQQAGARAFRGNMPSYVQDQSNMAGEQAANQALSGDKALNADSSKRVLLYSGLNEGAKSANRSGIANALMQRSSDINTNAQNKISG